MADPLARLRRFLRELKRRNVYKVAVTYAVVAFVVWQAADLLFPALRFPAWTIDFVIVLTLLGFPIAVVLAWAFEMTPEGVRRTPSTEPGAEGPEPAAERRSRSRLAVKILVGLGILAGAAAGGWYLTGGGGSTISDRSVAVLPFETLGDTASTPFTEGLHNDLLTRLQRVSELTVIARPSVMRYEETEKPLSQVAEELNARWIVTAAVQQAGDRVQVNPRLVDPRAGTERWSDSYQGELSADRVFALQQEITRSIADALEAELATGERERLEQRPTGDLEAYRLYVQGRRQLAQRSQPGDEHVQRAVRHFRRAIERDSSFALAWSGLADAAAFYPAEVPWGELPDAAAFDPSERPDSVVAPGVAPETAARRALELDPDLAEARASMGFVHLRNQNAPAALRELKRALELKPSYWEAHHWLGELYLKLGRSEQALEHLQLAVELNPQHARARHWLYDAYNATGQPEKALQEARRQQRMGLERAPAVGGEVRALEELGRLEEARELAREQVSELGVDTFWGAYFQSKIAHVLAAQGDTVRAREAFERARAGALPIEHVAITYARLGEFDRALETFGQLKEEDWYKIAAIKAVQSLGEHRPRVQHDARYEELLRGAYRVWGLNPDGSIPDSVDVSFEDQSDG